MTYCDLLRTVVWRRLADKCRRRERVESSVALFPAKGPGTKRPKDQGTTDVLHRFPETVQKWCRNGAETVPGQIGTRKHSPRSMSQITRISQYWNRFMPGLMRVGPSSLWCEPVEPVVSTDRNRDRGWEPWKFHFAQYIFILNWALIGATGRKKCKKLQFPALKL